MAAESRRVHWCYQCDKRVQVREQDDGSLRCLTCSEEYIEILEDGDERLAEASAEEPPVPPPGAPPPFQQGPPNLQPMGSQGQRSFFSRTFVNGEQVLHGGFQLQLDGQGGIGNQGDHINQIFDHVMQAVNQNRARGFGPRRGRGGRGGLQQQQQAAPAEPAPASAPQAADPNPNQPQGSQQGPGSQAQPPRGGARGAARGRGRGRGAQGGIFALLDNLMGQFGGFQPPPNAAQRGRGGGGGRGRGGLGGFEQIMQMFMQGNGPGGAMQIGDYTFGNIQDIINNLPQFANRQGPPPAAKDVVANLPEIEVDEKMIENAEIMTSCAVCKDDFSSGDKVLKLPCEHLYHKDCLLPWLNIHNSCPVCRFELKTDDQWYESQKASREGSQPPPGPNGSAQPPTAPAPDAPD